MTNLFSRAWGFLSSPTSLALARRQLVPLGKIALIWAFLAVTIAIAAWPWPLFFFTGLPSHWDPPLHTWKLVWNARHLLNGQFLYPVSHANSFYPIADTLYFDDLFWIPSLAFFWVYGLTGNEFLLYNTTALGLWSLSGLCMYGLLREWGLNRPACLFGSLAFCLMPYRVSYYVELNMQLNFGVPLALLLTTRLIKKPSASAAVCLGLALSAQAVSALYYAVILAFALPCAALRDLATSSLRQRPVRVAAAALAAGVVTVGLALPLLLPYADLRREMGFERSPDDAKDHALQPLSYLIDARTERSGPCLGVSPRAAR